MASAAASFIVHVVFAALFVIMSRPGSDSLRLGVITGDFVD